MRHYRFEYGLVGSLHDLALRCSAVAILTPLAVGLAALASGHQFFVEREASPASGPVLAAALASFMLEPMLALVGAICGVVVAVALARAPGPRSVRAWRGAFVASVGIWAVLMAVVYDVYLLPDLTI